MSYSRPQWLHDSIYVYVIMINFPLLKNIFTIFFKGYNIAMVSSVVKKMLPNIYCYIYLRNENRYSYFLFTNNPHKEEPLWRDIIKEYKNT